MKRFILVLAAVSSFGACSAFSTSSTEGDGVGSNTNWFIACDSDSECGAELGCVCGTCTRSCSDDSDCRGANGICPVDKHIFHEMCSSKEVDQLQGASFCAPSCDADADCGGAALCQGGDCFALSVDECAGAETVELSASGGSSLARTGSLFADRLYAPTYYSSEPLDWEENYTPNEYRAEVRDAQGRPLVGCQVQFVTEEASGIAFSESAETDEEGVQSALWVAGTAREQELIAAIVADDGVVLRSAVSGEASRHDEAPVTADEAGRDFTPPTAVVVWPESRVGATEIEVEAEAGSFPAWVRYTVLETSGLSLELRNRSEVSASEGEVPAADRELDVFTYASSGVEAELLALEVSGTCSSNAAGLRCAIEGAWELGEANRLRVARTSVAYGEIPAHEAPSYMATPCLGLEGCTDYEVYRSDESGGEELVIIVRHSGLDDFGSRTLTVTGTYRPDLRVAGSCLELEQASMQVRHRLLVDGEWLDDEAGNGWAYHESWQNQTCANYFMGLESGEFSLSTGGANMSFTPVLPGLTLSL